MCLEYYQNHDHKKQSSRNQTEKRTLKKDERLKNLMTFRNLRKKIYVNMCH